MNLIGRLNTQAQAESRTEFYQIEGSEKPLIDGVLNENVLVGSTDYLGLSPDSPQ